jgi:GMP synthase-like glutamine amidotransferase
MHLYVFKNLKILFSTLEWHGDTFERVEGALKLAGSKFCSSQVFIFFVNHCADFSNSIILALSND